MTVNRMINIMAGIMVLLSLTLAQFTHQIDLTHPTWLWLTGFVALNLFQMGFTGFCPAAKLFKIHVFNKTTHTCGTGSNGNGCC